MVSSNEYDDDKYVQMNKNDDYDDDDYDADYNVDIFADFLSLSFYHYFVR